MKQLEKMKKSEKNDVDIRFLLANERTLLAWIRTSLATEAGGVALIQLDKSHSYIGVTVMLLGAVVSIIGYHRYVKSERAIRSNRLPAAGIGPAIQVVMVVVIAIVLSIAQITFLRKA